MIRTRTTPSRRSHVLGFLVFVLIIGVFRAATLLANDELSAGSVARAVILSLLAGIVFITIVMLFERAKRDDSTS